MSYLLLDDSLTEDELIDAAAEQRYRAPVTETLVIFRAWFRKIDGPGVIALFPEQAERRPGMVLSYEHLGQHGAAHYAGVMSHTRAAAPEEYAALKRELESVPFCYRLRVGKRYTP